MREKEDEYYWWYFSEISCVYGYVFLEPKREQVVLLADVSNIFQTLKLEQNSLFQLILNKLKILHKYTIKLKYFWEISFTFLLLQSSCSILLLLFGISHLPTADSIFLGRLAWNRDVLLHSITLGPPQDLPGQFPLSGTRHILQVLYNNNIRLYSYANRTHIFHKYT